MTTRRTFLIAGGTALAAPALSGCLDSSEDGSGEDSESPGDESSDGTDDQPGDGEDGEQEYALSVERFVYTNDRARAYGEFDERSDATYHEGEMVWLYIGLANVTPTEGGTQLDTTWEVVGPDGEVRAATEDPTTIPGETLGELPNEAYLTQGIDTSIIDTPTSGEYTTRVTITDTESGESLTVSESFTLEKFQFDSVLFLENEPEGIDDYDENPEAIYERGEPVWVYLEFSNAPTDDRSTARLQTTFEVEQPDGQVWDPIERSDEWQQVGPDDVLAIWDAFTTYGDDPRGEYTLTISVEDQMLGTQIQTTETFRLE